MLGENMREKVPAARGGYTAGYGCPCGDLARGEVAVRAAS